MPRQTLCAGCGKNILLGPGSLPPGQATCQPCRQASRQATCPVCGVEFRSVKRSGGMGYTKTCSMSCSGHLRFGTEPRRCEVCGDSYRPKSHHRGKTQRTCGRACGEELRRTVTMTRVKTKYPQSRIYPTHCQECGTPYIARSSTGRYCTPTCAYRANVKQISARIVERYHTDPQFKDKVLTASHTRRADKLGLGQSTTKKQLLTYLAERDHNRCGICHQSVRATTGPHKPSIDHIVPLSKGGTHELANLQLAHYNCNLAKGNRGSNEQLRLIG